MFEKFEENNNKTIIKKGCISPLPSRSSFTLPLSLSLP